MASKILRGPSLQELLVALGASMIEESDRVLHPELSSGSNGAACVDLEGDFGTMQVEVLSVSRILPNNGYVVKGKVKRVRNACHQDVEFLKDQMTGMDGYVKFTYDQRSGEGMFLMARDNCLCVLLSVPPSDTMEL